MTPAEWNVNPKHRLQKFSSPCPPYSPENYLQNSSSKPSSLRAFSQTAPPPPPPGNKLTSLQHCQSRRFVKSLDKVHAQYALETPEEPRDHVDLYGPPRKFLDPYGYGVSAGRPSDTSFCIRTLSVGRSLLVLSLCFMLTILYCSRDAFPLQIFPSLKSKISIHIIIL